MDESQGGAGNEISRPGTSKVFFPQRQWWEIYNSSRRWTHSSSNTKIFCSNRSGKTTKSELCKAINSFSLQKAVAGVSGEESLVAVKETSKKEAIWNKELKDFKDG
jgi:hypothetical protein